MSDCTTRGHRIDRDTCVACGQTLDEIYSAARSDEMERQTELLREIRDLLRQLVERK